MLMSQAGAQRLLGRDAERDTLRALVACAPGHSRALVVFGDAGMGKTALLDEAASQASSAVMRVLSAIGTKSESNLAFAGLHQLLRPVLAFIADLPGQHARALRGALGLEAEPVTHDRLATGIAVLALLLQVSQECPVLLVVDDAQWIDRGSMDALAFAGHRLGSERVVLLVGARGPAAPAGFSHRFSGLRLNPLSAADASQLLSVQPHPPKGRARSQVLSQAAGNPLALIELARAIAADPAAGRRWADEPLPLTDRLTAVFADQLRSLPAATGQALLLAAVSDGADSVIAAGGPPGWDAGALMPAEELGLISVDRTGVRFSHPLVRSAVYHAAPFAMRAAAHRRLAEALHDQPDRRAWHLAGATLNPDETVASLLAATASQAQRRGGAAAAALALERAAELSPDPADQARRLVAAATVAAPTGQADWVQELAGRALAIAADPKLRLFARQSAGWALAWSNQHAAALSTLVPVASEASAHDPVMAWDTLATASSVAYQCGHAGAVQLVRDAAALLEQAQLRQLDARQRAEADASRLWIRASIRGCHDNTADTIPLPDPAAFADCGETAMSRAGAAAWLLDRSELAVELLQAARQLLQAPPVRGASGATLSALGWACLDTGRWDDALEVAAEAEDLAAAYQMDIVSASANLISGTILAARGEGDAARARISKALACDPEQSRSVIARARHALGLAALASGDYLVAYDQLRQLFTESGAPLHYHVSYLGVGHLAAAAVRADRRVDAQELVDRIQEKLARTQSPRIDQLLTRAQAVLTSQLDSEAHFGKALSDPAGAEWPFERAQLCLDFGEWLRRQRRINDAKPVLTTALVTFRRLRATTWIQQAEAELRACGVAIDGASMVPQALSGLTPQQREIAHLAARGLTNREIADRLFLSPRTVASHLYRSYPRLGVASRNQLRDVIAGTMTPAMSSGDAT